MYMAMHVIHPDFRGALNTVAEFGSVLGRKDVGRWGGARGSDKNRALSKRKL